MPQQPHILFFLTDQQRADCLSCAGHPVVRTPHIDRMASKGVRFTNAFTTSPLCVPARLSLACGLYPHNSNLWQNDATLPLDADTYMKRLQAGGYRTCSIGKNHLYPMENCDLYANEPHYQAVGYDHIEDLSGTWGVIEGTSLYTDRLRELGLLEPLRDYLRRLEQQPDEVRRYVAEPLPIPAEHYIDAFVADRVTGYVEQYDSGQPSFVFVGFQGPHEPWDVPDEYCCNIDLDRIPDPILEGPSGEWLSDRSRQYERWAQYYPPPSSRALKKVSARYFGKIAQIDESVGRILSAYERKGWLDQTLVIFASDHGEMLGDHNRLSKSVMYDSAIRVPLIVRSPDRAAGVDRDAFVETIDLYATILDIAGCGGPSYCDSHSLLPLLSDPTLGLHDDVLAEAHVHYMLRTKDRKLVVGRDGGTLQLFDLQTDPLEQRNLCGHPDHRTAELEMRSRLLSRIAANTFRPGREDPEHSGHFSRETQGR